MTNKPRAAATIPPAQKGYNPMKKTKVTTKEQLDALYSSSALTLEGLTADEENLDAFATWLEQHEALGKKEIRFHIISGALMNEVYGLTGTNAYPDDLTIVSVTNINQMKIAIPRFEIGGRWFDDVVDNNARRQNEK